MGCNQCDEKIEVPKLDKGCNTPGVIEIENAGEIITFHTVIIPASQGDEEDIPPVNGLYKNTLLRYEINGHTYLFNSDGIPVFLNKSTGTFDSLSGRPRYNGVEMTSMTDIPDVTASVEAEAALREAADEAEAKTRGDADDVLDKKIDDEISDRQEAISTVSGDLDAEVAARENADGILQGNIDAEELARTNADNTLQGNIDAEETARKKGDKDLQDALDAEITARGDADGILQGNIDAEELARSNAVTDLQTAISDEEAARIAADNLKADKSSLNEDVMLDVTLPSTASTTTVTLNKSTKNLSTGVTGSTSINLPVASSTQAGVINSSIYDAIQANTTNIDAILNGAVSVSGLSASPSQSDLTTAWQTATGLTTVINGAKINDSDNQKVWTYYTNTTTWYAATNTSQVTVSQWTNSTAGIVKGSTSTGQIFAESDGTGSVNGWDTLNGTVSGHTTSIGNLQTAVGGKEPAITAGTTSQYWRGDKTWQTLDKGAVGLSNADNTSDATKKSDFTGTIASADTGFVTGGDAYDALALKADSTDVPVITMQTTDPGEGSPLAANHFIAVYEA